MRDDLDTLLVQKYPKIFANRHADMKTTAMCWGFECSDGWFNIIDMLCNDIQSHIDWSRKQRAINLRYNRILKRALAGDKTALINYYTFSKKPDNSYAIKKAEEDIANQAFREVPDKVPQVVASQVKEKFGTLRFYYDGGDQRIDGMATFAESISGRICEECSAPGKSTSGGWIRTLCETHATQNGFA